MRVGRLGRPGPVRSVWPVAAEVPGPVVSESPVSPVRSVGPVRGVGGVRGVIGVCRVGNVGDVGHPRVGRGRVGQLPDVRPRRHGLALKAGDDTLSLSSGDPVGSEGLGRARRVKWGT